jgi:serine/threonine protein kinase
MESKVIHGYRLLGEFKTAGAGQCRWTFAKKDGKEYFIKEFLQPKYPLPGVPGSKETKSKNQEKCTRFEKRQHKVIDALRGKSVPGGNLIISIDFFRDGTMYYKVTEKVDTTFSKVVSLTFEQKNFIIRTIANSLGILHKAGIVHGDLKPDNILIKHTDSGMFVSKLIDLDDSYFSGDPPEPEDLVGDIIYYSPEQGRYVANSGDCAPGELTIGSDIFTLGLIIHFYLTGKLPSFDGKKYKYIHDAVNDGAPLRLDHSLKAEIRDFLNYMLDKDPEKRPSIDNVFDWAKHDFVSKSISPTPHSKPESPGKLIKFVGVRCLRKVPGWIRP